MTSLTVAHLLDVTTRAASVIAESEHADEHAELLVDLRAIVALCQDSIGASHMGCAADVAILERGDGEHEDETAFHARVLAALVERGIAATYEYPGFISIPANNGVSWSVGDVNGFWSGDRMENDGANAVGGFSLEGFAKADDPVALAAAIIEKIRAYDAEVR